ncbi:MAG: CdaR family protein [Anaerolineales bacterium]|jgi:YbbR domain-containing protein
MGIIRWLGRNLGTLLLALILAIVVWVSAVVAADPNEKRLYPRAVPLEVIGKDSNLSLSSELPTTVRVTIEAPQSIWTQLTNNPDLVKAWIDLSGMGAGDYPNVPVKVEVKANPARWEVQPQSVEVVLQQLVSKKLPVKLEVTGDLPVGYKRGTPTLSPNNVTVSGPQNLVNQVSEIHATLDINGARETRQVNVTVEARDQNGDAISGLTITPKSVSVTQPITLENSYKDVVVKVVTQGELSSGYRLTNISVTPPTVTVYSAKPELINQLPGYVETKPISIAGLSDDIEVRTDLNLPSEVSLVGVQSVLVQISVAAIEGSLTLSIPVETMGLPPDLTADISPATVDVIVSGPLPVLDSLTPASFRAVVDLTGQETGTYQLNPKMDLVPDQVSVQSFLPETVEVTITTAPTPTPTGLAPAAPAPTVANLPTPTPTKTP